MLNDEVGLPGVATEVRRFYRHIIVRRGRVLKVTKSTDWPSISQMSEVPIAKVQGLLDQINLRINELRSAADFKELKRLRSELQELEDRSLLSDLLNDVKLEITRKKKTKAFDAALETVDSTRVTRHSSKVADVLITDAWRDRFATEVRRLGLRRVNVELERGISSIGAAQFSVVLTRNRNATVGSVLSEGEHRCIAIAAFLSELSTADDKSALVFDDPVSSLDHDFREEVAERLVDEVKAGRQIIVFTHDVLFLEQLSRCAREKGILTKFQTVSQLPDSPYCGSLEDGVPPTIAPALDLAEGIARQVKHWESVFKAGQSIKWNQQTDSFSNQLRKCWERAVAEVLEPVIRRFDSHVNTKNVWQIAALEHSDFVEMRGAYKRCSELNHEKCAELGRKVPVPDDYYNEIRIVKEWIQRVRNKQLLAQTNHPPV